MELSKLIRPIHATLLKILAFSINKDIKKSVLIFADPRGGSTWLSELIRTETGTSVIWEPLHVGENPLIRNIGFGYRQHIPINAKWFQAKKAFTKVLKGKNLNKWTTQFTSVKELVVCDKLIVKICRGSMLLPWLIHNFDFERKPIYMIRHPFAVISSQLRHGSWDNLPNTFTISQVRYNEVFEEHNEFLKSIHSPEEILLCTWCITNGYILNCAGNNIDWISLTYEDLLLNPEQQIKRIYRAWGCEIPDGILTRISQPSQTADTSSPVGDGEEQLRYWKSYFSRNQIVKLRKVLDYFKIDLYDDAVLPKYNFV